MQGGDPSEITLSPELKSTIQKLQTLFAGALWDAKLNSSATAWQAIKRTRNPRKRREIFNTKAQEWRENSVAAITEWLPKLVALIDANTHSLSCDTTKLSRRLIWEVIEGQCGVSRPDDLRPWAAADRISQPIIYWCAVASEGEPPLGTPPWRPPLWLSKNSTEADTLLREQVTSLRLRLRHVIEEQITRLEIDRLTRKGPESLKVDRLSSIADEDRIYEQNEPSAATVPNPPKRRRGRPLNMAAADRREIIQRATAKGLKGAAYCEELGRVGLSTPFNWQKSEDCPKKYLDAYHHTDLDQRKIWRNRIADEKCRATRSKPLV
jgi:hypothetical protein